MTIRTFNPDGMAAPASNYSHAASAEGPMRWLHISGQVGTAPDGTLREGFAAQMEQCFENVIAVARADGMEISDIVKLVVYVTPHGPDVVGTYRDIRDRMMEGHAPAATYIGSVSLAHESFLVEIEAIAAKAV